MTPYEQMLSASWRDHLAPRSPDAPTVISLFAGGGGSSLGYAMAGYREVLAVEWDPYAASVLQANFADVPVHEGDIAALSIEDVSKVTGLLPGELDVLDGSPPCQGFSTSGRRDIADPRNTLFTEYVRMLRGLMPKALVMENVSGLVRGKMRLVFVEILRALKESGYLVSARLLDAAYYGVPQHRRRLIIIGVRDDLGISPSHPPAQGWPVSLRQALEGVEGEDVPPLSGKYRLLAPRIRPGQNAGDLEGGKGFQDLVRQRWDRPSDTVTKTNTGRGFCTPLHPVEDRSLSIPEAKRLCGFPDPFLLPGSDFARRWGVLGNAVPPPFMRAVADHIRATVLVPDLVGSGTP